MNDGIWGSGRGLAWVIALWMAAGGAGAAGGNLPAGAYPGPDCGARPSRPVRPESFRDNAEIEAYNEAVRRFNEAEQRHVECIQRYVDGAAVDIRMIRERVKAVIEDANRPAAGG